MKCFWGLMLGDFNVFPEIRPFPLGLGPLKGAFISGPCVYLTQRVWWDSPWLICLHSPVNQLPVPSLIIIQGSFSCSNKVIMSGLGVEHPAHKKEMPHDLQQTKTLSSKWLNLDLVTFILNSRSKCVCVCVCTQSCLTLCDSMDCSPQAPLSVEFSRQECQSGLPFPTQRDLPDPWIKSTSLMPPAPAGGFFSTVPPGKSYIDKIEKAIEEYSQLDAKVIKILLHR